MGRRDGRRDVVVTAGLLGTALAIGLCWPAPRVEVLNAPVVAPRVVDSRVVPPGVSLEVAPIRRAPRVEASGDDVATTDAVVWFDADGEERPAVSCPVALDGPPPDRHAGLEQLRGLPQPENALVVLRRPRPTPEAPGAVDLVPMPAQVTSDRLEFPVLEDFSEASVHIDGYLEARATWGELGCPTVRLERAASVVGTVDPAWGDPWVSGCGGTAPVTDDGRFRLDARPGSCEVVATRIDDDIQVTSEPVIAHARMDREVAVHLTLPDAVQGTIGLWVTLEEEGVFVTRTLDGLPGSRAGVEVGARVVAIDGVALDDIEAVSRFLMGPLGEDVDLTLATVHGTRTVTLEYAPFSAVVR